MEGFSYLNIFDTKGIEYLVILGFFAILIPFWIVLNRQVKITRELKKIIGTLTSKVLDVPQGLFFSRFHTWAHLERSGTAKVGLDDLLCHITGDVNFTPLKKEGDPIAKGELMGEVMQEGKRLKIFSPISGKVLDINSFLSTKSGSVEDPCGKGWIYKIKPVNWVDDTREYYLAEEATLWSKEELDRFKDFLAVSMKHHAPFQPVTVLQDGGELRDNVLSELPQEIWNDFQEGFLKP